MITRRRLKVAGLAIAFLVGLLTYGWLWSQAEWFGYSLLALAGICYAIGLANLCIEKDPLDDSVERRHFWRTHDEEEDK